MDVRQFMDLPQIQNMDEPQYPMWSCETYGVYPPKAYIAGFHLDQEPYFDSFDNSMMAVQPMHRFMHDPSSTTYGLLQPNLPLNEPYDGQYMSQWPLQEFYRNSSPDRTSISGTSTYATQNEACSPHALRTVSYGSSPDYSQMSHSDAAFGYSDDAANLSGASTYSRNITLREIEYAPQDTEHIVEDVETGSLKQEPVPETEPAVKTETTSESYKEFSDSGIGNSVRDAESVQPVDSMDEPASDSDYSPRPSRSGRRKRPSTSNASSSRVQKRRGYTRKNSTSSTSSTSNKPTRRHRGMPSTGCHRYSDDSRPFPCPLAAYSCSATFASKNEWKRHVSTQHIKLGFWRCDLCKPTTDPNDAGACYYNDFNRKDLFTQHLRRMHAAPLTSGSRTSKQFPVTDDNIGEHQTRCYMQLRDAPQRSICLFCDRAFAGPTSWDERMEHVGRHLEKYRKSGDEVLDVVQWNDDEELQQYLVAEGLIVQGRNGWKIGDGKARRMSASSEDED